MLSAFWATMGHCYGCYGLLWATAVCYGPPWTTVVDAMGHCYGCHGPLLWMLWATAMGLYVCYRPLLWVLWAAMSYCYHLLCVLWGTAMGVMGHYECYGPLLWVLWATVMDPIGCYAMCAMGHCYGC